MASSALMPTQVGPRLPTSSADVDECSVNNGGCDSKRKCTNTDGGFSCGDCPNGWNNLGAKNCQGSGEGMMGRVSRALGHMWACFADVDECAVNDGGCDSKRQCQNTNGGRTCGNCPTGWTNNGATGCTGRMRVYAGFIRLYFSNLFRIKIGAKLMHTDYADRQFHIHIYVPCLLCRY